MKSFMKISTLVLALCSLFSFTSNNHDVRSVKAAKGEGDEEWSLIGNVNDYYNPHISNETLEPITYDKDNWKQDFDFNYNATESQYELAFTFDAGEEFKIRKDHKWSNEGGVDIGFGGNPDLTTYLEAGENGNFKVKAAGTYLLKVADNDVANYGDKSYGLSLEPITTATFGKGDLYSCIESYDYHHDKQLSINSDVVTSMLITTDINKRPQGWTYSYDVGSTADQLTDDGKNIGAYFYLNESTQMYDLVIYANVQRIFAHADSSLMFSGWKHIPEIKIENLDTSRAIKMYRMFYGNTGITTIDLSMFDTSMVTEMYDMFYGCSSLKTLDLSSFDTSSATTISNMFYDCKELTEIKFSDKFTTKKITYFYSLFAGCSKLKTLDLTSFDTSNATNMEQMFSGCTSLTSLNISSFNTSNVTNMGYMFASCESLTSLDVSNFDTSKVTTMTNMFDGCKKLERIDLSNFNTASVTNMALMFRECESLTEIKFYDTLETNTFVTDNVTVMALMFGGCKELTTIDVSGFNTSKVTEMSYMFCFCDKLTTIKGLDKLDTSNVTNMRYMFARDFSLKSLDLSTFNTSKVTEMLGMFYMCTGLEKLDISSFDLSNITLVQTTIDPSQEYPSYSSFSQDWIYHRDVAGTSFMLDECTNLREIYTPTTIRSDFSIALPNQYKQVEGGVNVMDSTNTKTILFPGSLELNQLLNDMYYLNTCENYDQASTLRERYNALSDSDKEIFKTATDKDNVLMSAKLDYMEHMLALNSEAEKNNIHIMTTINDSPSFLVVATIISSLAILGYYMIQKRKSSID